MNQTIEFINARLAEAEAADRLANGEDIEPDPDELATVLKEWV